MLHFNRKWRSVVKFWNLTTKTYSLLIIWLGLQLLARFSSSSSIGLVDVVERRCNQSSSVHWLQCRQSCKRSIVPLFFCPSVGRPSVSRSLLQYLSSTESGDRTQTDSHSYRACQWHWLSVRSIAAGACNSLWLSTVACHWPRPRPTTPRPHHTRHVHGLQTLFNMYLKLMENYIMCDRQTSAFNQLQVCSMRKIPNVELRFINIVNVTCTVCFSQLIPR